MQLRTKRFAVAVIRVCNSLPYSAVSRTIASQLLRSATSIGANYRAVCRARSQADFVSKMGVVLEETDESAYWLELLAEAQIVGDERLAQLRNEAEQLTAIFAASRLTALGKR